MIAQIAISIAALFGVFQIFRDILILSRGIIFFQLIAIVLTFIQVPVIKTIGFYTFGALLFMVLIYLIIQKLDVLAKTLMLFITAPVLICFIFKMNHWPHVFELSLMMIVPIILYLILIARKFNVKNEIGFLTIITTQAAIEFSANVLYWLD